MLILGLGSLYGLYVLTGTLMLVDQEGFVMVLVGLSGLFLVFCHLIPLIFYKKEYGYLHPMVFIPLFLFANLVAKQTSAMVNGLPFHLFITGLSQDDLQLLFSYGNLLTGISFLAMYAGFARMKSFKGKDFGLISKSPGKMVWVAIGVFAIAAVTLLLYAKSYGSVGSFFLSLAKSRGVRSSMRDTEDEGMAQYAVPVAAATTAMLLWMCSRPNALRDIRFCVLAAASCFMAFTLGGKRTALVFPLLMLGCGWILVNRKVPVIRLALIGLAIFFFIGLVGLFRWTNQTSDEFSLDFLKDVSFRNVAGATAGEMSLRAGAMATYYSVLAEVPSKQPLRLGGTYLQYPCIFIPRAIWPTKPLGVDTQAGQTFADADWGMPPGAVGEAYWNFHIPGVIGVFFIYGILLRWLATLLLRNYASPLVRAFYVISLFSLAPTQNSVRGWVQAVIPLLLIGWAMGLLRKRNIVRSAPGSIEARATA